MTSTTEHVEYTDDQLLTRGQLASALAQSRRRVATLVNMLTEQKAAAAAARAEAKRLNRKLAAIKRALEDIE